MHELRWNPLLRTWTMVAAARQGRPHLPEGYDPFSPQDNPKLPSSFRVLAYPNDYPALMAEPPAPSPSPTPPGQPYATAPAQGRCEVILYTPERDVPLHALPDDHLAELVDLLCERTAALTQDPAVRYVFPFENRGQEVGVTIHHPHGQLYAYPFVPLKLEQELASAQAYHAVHGRNLFDAMNEAELQDGRRIIFEDEHFLGYLPHFTDYPYGLFLVARQPMSLLPALEPDARASLGRLLGRTAAMFDALFQRPFPYMMVVHQAPVNSPEWADHAQWYRLHIEYYPPLRAADKIKWYASSEMGAWAAANTRSVEETAKQLRAALGRL